MQSQKECHKESGPRGVNFSAAYGEMIVKATKSKSRPAIGSAFHYINICIRFGNQLT